MQQFYWKYGRWNGYVYVIFAFPEGSFLAVWACIPKPDMSRLWKASFCFSWITPN